MTVFQAGLRRGMLLRVRETAKTIITPPLQQPGRLSLPRLTVHPEGRKRTLGVLSLRFGELSVRGWRFVDEKAAR